MTSELEQLEIYSIADSFGIEGNDARIKHLNRIRRIIEWARNVKGAETRADIVAEVIKAKKHKGDLNIYDMSVFAGMELDEAENLKEGLSEEDLEPNNLELNENHVDN